MTSPITKRDVMVIAGLLLTFPAAYFLFICLMKFEFDFPAMYDTALPVLQSFGTNSLIGWNINFLILFGPLVALCLNVAGMVSLRYKKTEGNHTLELNIKKIGMNWSVIVISSLCLLALFIYLVRENLVTVNLCD